MSKQPRVDKLFLIPEYNVVRPSMRKAESDSTYQLNVSFTYQSSGPNYDKLPHFVQIRTYDTILGIWPTFIYTQHPF